MQYTGSWWLKIIANSSSCTGTAPKKLGKPIFKVLYVLEALELAENLPRACQAVQRALEALRELLVRGSHS